MPRTGRLEPPASRRRAPAAGLSSARGTTRLRRVPREITGEAPDGGSLSTPVSIFSADPSTPASHRVARLAVARRRAAISAAVLVVVGVALVALEIHVAVLAVIAVFSSVMAAIYRAFTSGHARSLMRRSDEASAELAAGEVDRAARAFEVLAFESDEMPALRPLFVARLGSAQIRQGQLDAAMANLEAARASGYFERDAPLAGEHAWLMEQIAAGRAARGEA